MSGFELLITGLQLHRSFENFTNNQFPKENLPVATAEFISLSSTILKGVTIEAAAAANLRSSGQMYAQVMPLIQTLNGITVTVHKTLNSVR